MNRIINYYKWELKHTMPVTIFLLLLKYFVLSTIPLWLALLPLYLTALLIFKFFLLVGLFFGFALFMITFFNYEV